MPFLFDSPKLTHYYGDTVRMIFIICALIMLFGLPAITGYINMPVGISVAAILVLAIAAGLSSPRLWWTSATDLAVSALGFIVFEIATIDSFATRSAHGEFFIANLALSSLFLIATYFSVKTVRSSYSKQI